MVTATAVGLSFGTPEELGLEKRFAAADAKPKVDEKKAEQVAEIKARWAKEGVNPFLLKHRRVPGTTCALEAVVFKAIVDGQTLRISDVVSFAETQEEKPKKAPLERTAKAVFAALCDLKVAREIKKGLYQV